MPQGEQAAAPEVVPLSEFIRTLSEGLRANGDLDQGLVAILDTHLINGEINDKSVTLAASAIEKLAIERSEPEHA